MNIRIKPSKPKTRDLGLDDHGAGKGDSPRNCFSPEFKNNFDQIAGFSKTRGRFRKVYR